MRILFFANDIGGGNLLIPLAERARQRKNALFFLASGPSLRLWREKRYHPIALTPAMSVASIRSMLARIQPDIVVTGTSIGTKREHCIWAAARMLPVPTLAMIDGWAKLPGRFPRRRDNRTMPNRVGVVDQGTAQLLTKSCGLSPASIDIIGHPHLQCTTQQIGEARAGRSAGQPLKIGFFSSPLVNTESTPGLKAIELLLTILEQHLPITLVIKPHSRESIQPWRDWLSSNVLRPWRTPLRLVNDISTMALLSSVDAVISLSDSVLLEAAFSGIPVLAIQLGEASQHDNAAIETYLAGWIARSPTALSAKVSALFDRIDRAAWLIESPVTRSADTRAMKAISLAAVTLACYDPTAITRAGRLPLWQKNPASRSCLISAPAQWVARPGKPGRVRRYRSRRR